MTTSKLGFFPFFELSIKSEINNEWLLQIKNPADCLGRLIDYPRDWDYRQKDFYFVVN